MSEQLSATVSFDEQGKPVGVEPSSALLAFGVRNECLVVRADPDVDLGSADRPERCASCGTRAYIERGIYQQADTAEPACPRFTGRSETVIELAAAACAELRVEPAGQSVGGQKSA